MHATAIAGERDGGFFRFMEAREKRKKNALWSGKTKGQFMLRRYHLQSKTL